MPLSVVVSRNSETILSVVVVAVVILNFNLTNSVSIHSNVKIRPFGTDLQRSDMLVTIRAYCKLHKKLGYMRLLSGSIAMFLELL